MPCLEIEARRRVQDDSRPGESREPDEVDVERLAAVMTGDVTGQHAGIGGARARIDQGQPRAGQRVHAPFAQDERMGVPPANEDQVSGEGPVRRHAVQGPGNRVMGCAS